MDGELKFKPQQTDETEASGAPPSPPPSPETATAKAGVSDHYAALHWDKPLTVTVMLHQAVSYPAPSPVASEAQHDVGVQPLPKSVPRASPAMRARDFPFFESSVAIPVPGLQPSSARHPGYGSGAGVATTPPAQRHGHQHCTPHSRDSIPVGASGHASAECMTSQASFPTVFPTSYAPDSSHVVWPPAGSDAHAMFAGTGYVNHNVYAPVVDGRIVPSLPVPRFDAPADNWKVYAPLVNWNGAPDGSAHAPIVDVPRQWSAESTTHTNPDSTPSGLRSRQEHDPEDEIFDIEALERSLADSVTSSSLSDALVNSYGAPGLARPVGSLPAQYSGPDFVAVRGWSVALEPQGST